MKLHLLIQGQLITKNPNNTKIGKQIYDCREDLKKLIVENIHLIESVTIVTWDGQPRISQLPKTEVFYIADKYKPIMKYYGYGRVFADNKRKMYAGLDYGIKAIEKKAKKDDFVLKLRTDQQINLKEIYNFIKHCALLHEGHSIFVPHIPFEINQCIWMAPPPAFFSDYYFAAKFENMKIFIGAQIELPQLVRCTHADSFYKYVRAIYPDEYEKNKISFHILDGKFYSNASVALRLGYEHLFFPFCKSVFTSLRWRGDFINSDPSFLEGKTFYEEWIVGGVKSICIESIKYSKYPKINFINKYAAFEKRFLKRHYSIHGERYYCIQKLALYYNWAILYIKNKFFNIVVLKRLTPRNYKDGFKV